MMRILAIMAIMRLSAHKCLKDFALKSLFLTSDKKKVYFRVSHKNMQFSEKKAEHARRVLCNSPFAFGRSNCYKFTALFYVVSLKLENHKLNRGHKTQRLSVCWDVRH